MAFAPDKNDPFPKPKGGGKNDKDKNKGGKGYDLGGFMPAQMDGLASDLSIQSGAPVGKMESYLRDLYSPVKLGGFNTAGGSNGNGDGNGNNNGGGGHNDPRNPGGGPNTGGDGGFDPASPRNRMAPMTFPLGFQPDMGMQQPAMAAQQQQIPGQRPLTPEMIALIRSSMMRG